MTKRESAIISAFTGILCGPFDEFHKYVEYILDRPVFTHELANKAITKEIKEKSRADFIDLVESIN